MSFVKRFSLPKNMKIEARMDLFNVFDTINFNAIAPSALRRAATGWAARSRTGR